MYIYSATKKGTQLPCEANFKTYMVRCSVLMTIARQATSPCNLTIIYEESTQNWCHKLASNTWHKCTRSISHLMNVGYLHIVQLDFTFIHRLDQQMNFIIGTCVKLLCHQVPLLAITCLPDVRIES